MQSLIPLHLHGIIRTTIRVRPTEIAAQVTPVMNNMVGTHHAVSRDNLAMDFKIFHKQSIHLINHWKTQDDAHVDPYWILWKMWVWKGLKAHSKWQRSKY
jgi:hypothetical protein